MAQLQLQREVLLTLVPMAKQVASSRGATDRWRSQTINESAPISTGDSVKVKPDKTIEIPKSGLSLVESSTFYVPTASNQEGFDSFIVHNKVLYIFQFTIAASHDIKGGLMDFFSQEPFKEILRGIKWHFIFVMPPRVEVECRETSDERMKKVWKETRLFSARLDPQYIV